MTFQGASFSSLLLARLTLCRGTHYMEDPGCSGLIGVAVEASVFKLMWEEAAWKPPAV